jgi:hypothetical protein
MDDRHEKLGFKQVIRLEWMDKTVQMLLAGMTAAEIRRELDHYLSTQKQSGGEGERGKTAYKMAISLLSSWFDPDVVLHPLRDSALLIARQTPADHWLPLHWAVLSASYPFWLNTALQVGRLLNLQDQVRQAQIFNRLKEQYGDRETVARNARYAVRSLVAWGVLVDSNAKGCYEKRLNLEILDVPMTMILLEATLFTMPEGKAPLKVLRNFPAFFPFCLTALNGDIISQQSTRIDVMRYGLDDEILKLSNLS